MKEDGYYSAALDTGGEDARNRYVFESDEQAQTYNEETEGNLRQVQDVMSGLKGCAQAVNEVVTQQYVDI